MRVVLSQAWFLMVFLTTTVYADNLNVTTRVALTGLPNDPRLLMAVKNEGRETLTCYKWSLPWEDSNSLLIAAVREDGISLKKALMFDHGASELVSLKPGESVEGTVPVTLYFPDIHKDLEQTGVILFWSYQMVLKDGRKLDRSGGWLLLSKTSRQLHDLSSSNSKSP